MESVEGGSRPKAHKKRQRHQTSLDVVLQKQLNTPYHLHSQRSPKSAAAIPSSALFSSIGGKKKTTKALFRKVHHAPHNNNLEDALANNTNKSKLFNCIIRKQDASVNERLMHHDILLPLKHSNKIEIDLPLYEEHRNQSILFHKISSPRVQRQRHEVHRLRKEAAATSIQRLFYKKKGIHKKNSVINVNINKNVLPATVKASNPVSRIDQLTTELKAEREKVTELELVLQNERALYAEMKKVQIHLIEKVESFEIERTDLKAKLRHYYNLSRQPAPVVKVETEKKPKSEWIQMWDEAAQAAYYYNQVTAESSWERPDDCVEAESEPKTKEEGASKEATSDADSGGDDWVEAHDENNNLYYYNNATKETSWQDPRAKQLPEVQSDDPVNDEAAALKVSLADEGEKGGETVKVVTSPLKYNTGMLPAGLRLSLEMVNQSSDKMAHEEEDKHNRKSKGLESNTAGSLLQQEMAQMLAKQEGEIATMKEELSRLHSSKALEGDNAHNEMTALRDELQQLRASKEEQERKAASQIEVLKAELLQVKQSTQVEELRKELQQLSVSKQVDAKEAASQIETLKQELHQVKQHKFSMASIKEELLSMKQPALDATNASLAAVKAELQQLRDHRVASVASSAIDAIRAELDELKQSRMYNDVSGKVAKVETDVYETVRGKTASLIDSANQKLQTFLHNDTSPTAEAVDELTLQRQQQQVDQITTKYDHYFSVFDDHGEPTAAEEADSAALLTTATTTPLQPAGDLFALSAHAVTHAHALGDPFATMLSDLHADADEDDDDDDDVAGDQALPAAEGDAEAEHKPVERVPSLLQRRKSGRAKGNGKGSPKNTLNLVIADSSMDAPQPQRPQQQQATTKSVTFDLGTQGSPDSPASDADNSLFNRFLSANKHKGCQTPSGRKVGEWTECVDANSGTVYFHNKLTDEVQWEPPGDFERRAGGDAGETKEVWQHVTTPNGKGLYWYNWSTGSTAYDTPQQVERSRMMKLCSTPKASHSIRSQALWDVLLSSSTPVSVCDSQWEQYRDSRSGEVYYYNAQTKQSQWEEPAEWDASSARAVNEADLAARQQTPISGNIHWSCIISANHKCLFEFNWTDGRIRKSLNYSSKQVKDVRRYMLKNSTSIDEDDGGNQHLWNTLKNRAVETGNAEVPDGWVEFLDETSSELFYFESTTDCFQWDKPGEEDEASVAGDASGEHRSSVSSCKSTLWRRLSSVNADTVFWHHAQTGEVSYVEPVEEHEQHHEQHHLPVQAYSIDL